MLCLLLQGLLILLQFPNSAADWLIVAEEFEHKWQFPHCIGALDGKHIVLQAPINSGSEFFNYKRQFSIVLMAAVDANYSFLFTYVGYHERISDRGVFKNTDMNINLKTKF